MNHNDAITQHNVGQGDYVLMVTIVEPDFAEHALEAARAKGAEGCTIIHGRGKQIGREESIFSVPLDLRRDLVLTLVRKEDAAAVQEQIFEAVGLKTQGHGLVYQLPVDALSGIVCGHTFEQDGVSGHIDKGGNG